MTAPPNVVVIMADQMALGGIAGEHRETLTPSLVRLARTGVRFENAFTPHPLCCPARVSLWTSTFASSHGSNLNQTPLATGYPHAFRSWKEGGLVTGLIGKNHCFNTAEADAAFDTWLEIDHHGLPPRNRPRGGTWLRPPAEIQAAHAVRRAMPMQTPRVSFAISDRAVEDTATYLVGAQVERFIEEHAERPFALWVSFPDPHPPYEAPRPYVETVRALRLELPPWETPRDLSVASERLLVLRQMIGLHDEPPDLVHDLLNVYFAMVRLVDDSVGRIVNTLQRLGLRESTIVVFCSDHGDFAGEHAMVGKGGLFFDCLTKVPLIASWPGSIRANVVEHSLVSLIDVVPTLLGLQGIPVPTSMLGRTLPAVTDVPPRTEVFAEYGAGGPLLTLAEARAEGLAGRAAHIQTLGRREAEGHRRMVRTDRWKLVRGSSGESDELYDLAHDPWELSNLAGLADYDVVRDDLGQHLEAWKR